MPVMAIEILIAPLSQPWVPLAACACACGRARGGTWKLAAIEDDGEVSGALGKVKGREKAQIRDDDRG
jgi:hypothetical protein